MLFDAREDCFTVTVPAFLMEQDSTIGRAKLLNLCAVESLLSLLAFKWIAVIHSGYHVGDELPFLGYISETGCVPDVVAMRAQNVRLWLESLG